MEQKTSIMAGAALLYMAREALIKLNEHGSTVKMPPWVIKALSESHNSGFTREIEQYLETAQGGEQS